MIFPILWFSQIIPSLSSPANMNAWCLHSHFFSSQNAGLEFQLNKSPFLFWLFINFFYAKNISFSSYHMILAHGWHVYSKTVSKRSIPASHWRIKLLFNGNPLFISWAVLYAGKASSSPIQRLLRLSEYNILGNDMDDTHRKMRKKSSR